MKRMAFIVPPIASRGSAISFVAGEAMIRRVPSPRERFPMVWSFAKLNRGVGQTCVIVVGYTWCMYLRFLIWL